MPKISVIMSVYNGQKYLKEAIESILNQTFKDFEFLIINDGSTDKTPEILEKYKRQDRRIKIINNAKNIGLTKSLNKGINIARGEYIARMDADDISLPERLEKQINFLDSHSEIGLLGAAYFEINEKGEIIGKKIFPVSDQELRKRLIRFNPFFHASIMIRKKILNEVGGYNEEIKRAQDYELWFRIAKKTKIANLPEPLMKRRYTKENISVKNENEQIKLAIEIRKKAIKERQYPSWCWIYLLRPYVVLKSPTFLRVFIRRHLLKNNIYK